MQHGAHENVRFQPGASFDPIFASREIDSERRFFTRLPKALDSRPRLRTLEHGVRKRATVDIVSWVVCGFQWNMNFASPPPSSSIGVNCASVSWKCVWNACGWNQNWPFERLRSVATAKRGISAREGFHLYNDPISWISRNVPSVAQTTSEENREETRYTSYESRTVCKRAFSFLPSLPDCFRCPIYTAERFRSLSIAILWTSFPAVKLNSPPVAEDDFYLASRSLNCAARKLNRSELFFSLKTMKREREEHNRRENEIIVFTGREEISYRYRWLIIFASFQRLKAEIS